LLNPSWWVEEGDPVVELQLRSMGVATKGKLDGFFPKYGELDVGKVAAGLAETLDIPYAPPQPVKAPLEPAPRPPALCPGRPHMDTFYILRVATSGLNPVWSGDIGCYSLGINMGQQDLLTHILRGARLRHSHRRETVRSRHRGRH
jgi:indolepyruvate ferredoxin oxidoreductase alpha subunit